MTAGTPRLASCHAASEPARPPPMIWTGCMAGWSGKTVPKSTAARDHGSGKGLAVRQPKLVGRPDAVRIGHIELLRPDALGRLHVDPTRCRGQVVVPPGQQH